MVVMRNADAVSALERDLRTIFGSRLQSLVAYGATSKTEGPVTTLAIVDGLAAADLQACANRVAGWRLRGLGTPLVLEAKEFGRSLDVFPFEFGTILADHVVIAGTDPFDGLAVDPADLRRACEVQARSHLLHLREGYMEAEGRREAVAELIVRSAPALAALLAHVVRLTGTAVPDPVLVRVAELGERGTISADEAGRIIHGYLEAVGRLVGTLDRWGGS
jgi:hypothetical protein